MHENFVALEQEKRDRIINAAMREFSSKGFRNASTNEIVKAAGISKGALFHYFASKHELFEFLYNYSVDVFLGALTPSIDSLPRDVFERWSAFGMLKIKIGMQYPQLAEFAINANNDEDKGVQDFLKAARSRMSEDFISQLYNDVDTARFRPGTDAAKALKIIWWVLDGFSRDLVRSYIDPGIFDDDEYVQATMREMDGYLEMLKKAFY